MLGCLLEILLPLISPRLLLFLIGAGMAWGGGHMFGEARRGDAPLRRALGPAGIPVEATVYSQRAASRTNPKGDTSLTTRTRLRYEHGGQPQSEEAFLDDKAERELPEGSRIACRLDPENPQFIVSAKTPWPWTKTKLALCVLLIAAGALIDLGVLIDLAGK